LLKTININVKQTLYQVLNSRSQCLWRRIIATKLLEVKGF